MFNEEVIIDRNNLDEECAQAPAFFDYWYNQEVNAIETRDNRKTDIEMDIRSLAPEEACLKYKLNKITDRSVEAAINSNIEYRHLRRRAAEFVAQRKSFEKKMAMLETLAKLHGQSYFSKIESRPSSRSEIAAGVRAKIKRTIEARKKKRVRKTE